MRSHDRSGFTLVEMLIVITIIGMLLALLLPAVQYVRESGRRTICLSNVKNLADACLLHESKHGFFPTGGWNRSAVGEPDKGFDAHQPGGWHYSILPYIEQKDLYDLGLDPKTGGLLPQDQWDLASRERSEMVVPLFLCPSRHKGTIARSDYAANSGSNYAYCPPPTLNDTNLKKVVTAGRYSFEDNLHPSEYEAGLTGVIYAWSTITVAHITDGPAFTYLLGERWANPDYYEAQSSQDSTSWNVGYCEDVNRWTGFYDPKTKKQDLTKTAPAQDNRDITGYAKNFGSAHFNGFHMAFCDGSARPISYNIDPVVHKQLGHRCDGKPTNMSEIFK